MNQIHLKEHLSAKIFISLCASLLLTQACLAKPAAIKSSQSTVAKSSQDARAGKQLFEKLNCAECHSVSNAGGCLAPPLDGVGSRRSAKYLELRLSNTAEQKFIDLIGHPELFPHPRFSPSVVKQLVAYLQTLPVPAGGLKLPPHPHKSESTKEESLDVNKFKPLPISADSAEGRRLFFDGGCMACHTVNGAGAHLAPPLDGIGARHSRKYIEAHINNPQEHLLAQACKSGAKSRMPQFSFSQEEVSQITDFLLTLPARK